MRPAQPVGSYGIAMQRAAWHRSFIIGQVVGVPMERGAQHVHRSQRPVCRAALVVDHSGTCRHGTVLLATDAVDLYPASTGATRARVG